MLKNLLALGLLTGALIACDRAPEKTASPDAGTPAGGTSIVAGEIPAPPDVAAAPADAEKTASGLASKKLQAGTGTVSPHRWDSVTVNYTGWTTDGKMFDSSVKRGMPATFALGAVIKGWTEGLQLMKTGEKRRFWIPQELAYQGRPGGPQGMLVFDVELISIKPGPKPIPAPADVAAPPADAKKTPKGVFYKMLQPGTGKEKPDSSATVKVHYTGWTTDGEMFDSSVQRGKPIDFPLNKVIPGWSEGVQQMVLGEKARLWIPQDLAYQGRPGAPQGMLVFDIELLEMTPGIKAPVDVKAPPKSAKKTKSGIAYVVLTKGKAKEHPLATSEVEVHYSGWTTDGQMFDSSVQRKQPATFSLGSVIPGWTEGLQLMSPGDKFLFWIPEELAYKGQPGRPQGTLVFEVELLSIKK